MQRLISVLVNLFPQRYKKVFLGSAAKHSRFRSLVHSFLNVIPGGNFPVLPCGGALEGYRMKIDWRRHRSFIYGTWESHVVSAVSGVVPEGGVAIDIGSHFGFYTLLLSKLVGPRGTVVSFEPLPGNFKMLEENIGLNHLQSRVRAVRKAVLDRSLNEMKLTVPCEESSSLDSSPWGSFFINGGDSVTVETVSIDDFISGSKLPVNFIKMDAEGAEELILRGALETIERYHPTMLIELHHPGSRGDDHPAVPLLDALGYEIEWLDRLHPTSHILARWGKVNNTR